MARRMYRCQLRLISDWQKAMIAHVIWRDGRRYGALGEVSLWWVPVCVTMNALHLCFGLQGHEWDLAHDICGVVWPVSLADED
jgi:hypothetical protein